MQTYRFLSRVTFICNICCLLSVVMLLVPHPPQVEWTSVILILGYFAVLINGLINLWGLVLLIQNRIRSQGWVPGWLAYANFIFLVAQLVFILR